MTVPDFVPKPVVQPAPVLKEAFHQVGWQPVIGPDGRVEEHGLPYILCSDVDTTGSACADCDDRAHRLVVEWRMQSLRPGGAP